MRKKIYAFVIAAVFAASLIPTVFAAEAPASATAKPAASYKSKSTPATMSVMGKVVNVSANSIEINTGTKGMAFAVNAKTAFLKKGETLSISQLAKDSQVKVRYAGDTAKTIEVM